MFLLTNNEEKNKLMKVIETLRDHMINTGIKEGFSSHRTLTISQKLDEYIVKYQSL